MTSPCAFCGHPDSRHRVVDAITELIEAGENREGVLLDYGWTEGDYARVAGEVAAALGQTTTKTGGRDE